MDLRDLLEISIGNLRRMKLRATLTVSGVVIAIGAFVSMVSFGAGIQQNVSAEYEKLGLFTAMQVYRTDAGDLPDSVAPGVLNRAAVRRLSELPGVRLAYAYEAFSVSATLDTITIETDAQVLPVAALGTRAFSNLLAGRRIGDSTVGEALVTDRFLEEMSIEEPDSIVGRTLVLAVKSSTLDSGIVAVFSDEDRAVRERLRAVRFDSLFRSNYAESVVVQELGAAVKRFMGGYLNKPMVTTDTLTVVGVLEQPGSGRLQVKPVIVPETTARKFAALGGATDPTTLAAALQSGELEGLFGGDTTSTDFSRVTLDLEATANYAVISDSIRALGFRPYSFAEQFQEIRKFFFYFDLALGVIGLIALVTASLGIVNTMVMSIIERRREIGILKALGADERDIRRQFLVESAVIGSVGGILGILLGWIVTRIASLVALEVMERQGIDQVELFALPLWLMATAFLFGFLVSLMAGLYPAARAARVDPVEALRNE